MDKKQRSTRAFNVCASLILGFSAIGAGFGIAAYVRAQQTQENLAHAIYTGIPTTNKYVLWQYSYYKSDNAESITRYTVTIKEYIYNVWLLLDKYEVVYDKNSISDPTTAEINAENLKTWWAACQELTKNNVIKMSLVTTRWQW